MASNRTSDRDPAAPASVVVPEGAFAALHSIAGLPDQVRILEGDLSDPAGIELATREADALVVTLQRLDATAVGRIGPRVRVIGRAGVGLDSIDLDAVRRRGLALFNEPAYGASEVASHAAALLLAVQRRLVPADAFVRRGWGGPLALGDIRPLDELTLGVVGCGRIGRAFVERLAPSVRQVLVFDPALDAAPTGARLVPTFGDLLRASDLVSLHLPLSPSTRHLIGAPELELLPLGATLVNVSRGGLVDEAAVAAALRSGRLAGAAFDVYEQEPLPAGSPLLEAPNVLLTPHVAAKSDRADRRLATWTITDAVSWLQRGRVEHGEMVIDAGR